MKKPNQAKLKTRPYTLIGFKAGIERAFLFTGFTSGICQRLAKFTIVRGRLADLEGMTVTKLRLIRSYPVN